MLLVSDTAVALPPPGIDPEEPYEGAEAVEAARRLFGFTLAEIAEVLLANETTLHRWRSGRSRPTPVYLARLQALRELATAIARAFPDRAVATAWLHEPNATLGGRTPRAFVLDGRGDVLLGVLLAAPAGGAPRERPAPDGAAPVTARVAAILETMSDAFFMLDLDWRFTFVNQRAASLLALEPSAIVGRRLDELFPGIFERRFGREYERALEDQVPVTFEEFAPRIGLWTEVRAFPSPFGLAVFFQDISARKRAEAERGQLASILEMTPDLVTVATPDGRVIYANAAARAQFGSAALPGQPLADERVYPRWARERVWTIGIPAALGTGAWRGDSAYLAADGREVPVSQVVVVGRDDAGRVEYLATTMRDISAERAAAAAVSEREARLRGLLDTLSPFAGLLTPAGTVLEVNARVARFGGVTTTDLVGRPFWDAPWMRHDPVLQSRLRALVRVAAAGEPVSVKDTHRLPDGQPMSIELALVPVTDADGRVRMIVVEGRDLRREGDVAALAPSPP